MLEFSDAFHRHPLEIDLTLACVGELNTIMRGNIPWPVIYGIGVNVRTGELFPATFPDKGPDCALRTARFIAGGSPQANQVLKLYINAFILYHVEISKLCTVINIIFQVALV